MNENIGSKGGKNDRRRTLIITKKQKEKLESIESIKRKKAEKNLKKKDLEILIKIIPLIMLGNIFQVFNQNEKKKIRESEIKVNNSVNTNKVSSVENITNKNKGSNKIIRIANQKKEKYSDIKKEQSKYHEIEIQNDNCKKLNSIKENTISNINYSKKSIINKENNNNNYISKENGPEHKKYNNNNIENKGIMPIVNFTAIKKKISHKEKNTIMQDTSEKANSKILEASKNIDKLTNIKLIESYEKELHNIRFELKKILFEYKLLEEYSENTYTSSEIEDLINKLNIIISKIEELRKKLDIDNLSNYDDDYIRSLVNEYISTFGSNEKIEGIEDSELYILLSNIINNVKEEQIDFKEKLVVQEQEIIDSEKNIDELRTNFLSISNFNSRLESFQLEQEALLKKLQEKIANSESIEERIETEIKLLNKQSKNLLKLLTLEMMIPDPLAAKTVGAATLAYMYFIRRALKPKLQIKHKRHKIITIEDFSKDIQNTITDLNYATSTIHSISKKLESMITEFQTDYKEYINNVPEYSELLSHLMEIKENLREKEYDIKKIVYEQKKNLQLNNEKVKILEKNNNVS